MLIGPEKRDKLWERSQFKVISNDDDKAVEIESSILDKTNFEEESDHISPEEKVVYQRNSNINSL